MSGHTTRISKLNVEISTDASDSLPKLRLPSSFSPLPHNFVEVHSQGDLTLRIGTSDFIDPSVCAAFCVEVEVVEAGRA